MEELGAKVEYIEGKNHIVADVLSRYPTENDPLSSKTVSREQMSEMFAVDKLPAALFPLSFKAIARFQQKDKKLQTLAALDKNLHRKTFYGGYQLICQDDKIYIPTSLCVRKQVVNWYHDDLCHPGETRTEETIKQHLYMPRLRQYVKEVVGRCATCQLGKKKRIKYGLIPPKVAESTPWQHLCVDTVGPYIIRTEGRVSLTSISKLSQ